MRLFLMLLSFGLVVASSTPVEAAVGTKGKIKKSRSSTKAKKMKKASRKEQSKIGTSHNFDDHGVTGEYQMPDEALAKVENEKSLTDLLGVRKHFKDRLAEASEQE